MSNWVAVSDEVLSCPPEQVTDYLQVQVEVKNKLLKALLPVSREVKNVTHQGQNGRTNND